MLIAVISDCISYGANRLTEFVGTNPNQSKLIGLILINSDKLNLRYTIIHFNTFRYTSIQFDTFRYSLIR